MSYKNKRQSLGIRDRRWGINKNRKKLPFNRSIFKTLTQLQFQPNNSKPKYENIKTFPTQYSEPPIYEPISPQNQFTQLVQNPETCPNLQLPSIQQADAKIDILLKQKLKLLVNINKNKFFNKGKNILSVNKEFAQQIIRLNSDIQNIIENIKMCMNDSKVSDSMVKWNELNRKIKMLEKVMAENESEGDIMKKYFTKVSQNVTTYRNFCHSPNVGTINKLNSISIIPKERKSMNITSRMPFSSTNSIVYRLPNVDDYQKFRYSQPKPNNANESIIQLSSYKNSHRSFAHPNIPAVSRSYSSLSIRPPSRKQTSSYKQQFKPFKQKRVNYKQLDCYKNKFKNLNITYDKRQQSTSVGLIAEYIKLQQSRNKIKTLNNTKVQNKIETVPTPRSTCHIDYDRILDRQRRMYAAKPKNSHLDLLRSSFKKLIND